MIRSGERSEIHCLHGGEEDGVPAPLRRQLRWRSGFLPLHQPIPHSACRMYRWPNRYASAADTGQSARHACTSRSGVGRKDAHTWSCCADLGRDMVWSRCGRSGSGGCGGGGGGGGSGARKGTSKSGGIGSGGRGGVYRGSCGGGWIWLGDVAGARTRRYGVCTVLEHP